MAAAPGVGKSVFALTLAIWAGVPTLYISADSDAATQYARAASMITGHPVAMVQAAIERNEVEHYDAAVDGARHIKFVFDSSPSIDDLNRQMLAYGWVYGQWPQLIIVDNASNIYSEQEGFAGLEEVMDWLHQLARKTSSCVVALHHVTGDYETGDIPVPLSGLRGKISKLPALVLTANRVFGEPRLNVAVVKNRSGLAAANGSFGTRLGMDLSRMWIESKLPAAR
ncbi:AAA domain-containing protein [Sinosporangium album]|uniref:AAA domain-containing protein n=1 Tax=Sinosporangium album TaxID=504805 RepID=A0A1G8AA28_9ACTN|nr:AAA domain-containing protein [Sinosporangium album]